MTYFTRFKKGTLFRFSLLSLDITVTLRTFMPDEGLKGVNHRQSGILVKLVTCVYSGHPKIKITNFMKYAIFNWFLPWHTILLVKNWFGNLIALLTNILWDFHVPRRHRKKLNSTFGQKKYKFCTYKVPETSSKVKKV